MRKCFCVINGAPQKQYFNNIDPPTFSPDTKHIACAATDGKEWFYIIDGQKQSTYGGSTVSEQIFFSPDSKHYAYIAETKEGYSVIKDGNQGRTFLWIFPNSLKFSVDSRHYACMAIEPFKWTQIDIMLALPFHLLFAVVRDDKVEFRKNMIIPDSIVFSSDSSRMASSEVDKANGSRVIVDEKQYQIYDNYINEPIFPVFTDDSRFVVYAAKKRDKWFMVVDENEGKEYDFILGPLRRKIIIDGPDTFYYIAQEGSKAYLVEERIRVRQ